MLFDRDDTLIRDVPYNGRPELVEPMPGARAALELLRAHGVRLGVVTNQSGIGRGLLTEAQVSAVNRRTAELLGPFGAWETCPHAPAAGCFCRKPRPGMLLRAMERLGAPASATVMIGDIGADMVAASAAGCRGVLVPTAVTLAPEVAAAPAVAAHLGEAVRLALGAEAAGGSR
ncbi:MULTISPECIES: D-glycero-alpha-D-manno-heptose-1,7-bisphosphate 7-phosphatase [Brevibacterium]|uniref:D-glycero-alpha-D-manno-heptose-1,7-bisphosphate 7-phosphatase n=1 Tax=Brevibacterium TaxID=1696 RepID=UPI0025BDE8E9|nr:HAD family hydrolase [Brevibacterium sp.]